MLLASRPRPNKNMHLASWTAMVGAIMFGLDQGNFGNVQTFPGFREAWCQGRYGNEVTCGSHPDRGAGKNASWQRSFLMWSTSLIAIGAAFGGLTVGPVVARRFGRRPCISVGASICCLGCVVVAFLTFGRVPVFMVGRFVTGFGVGVCCFTLTMYNAEIATPDARGFISGLFQLNVVVGGLVATAVTWAYENWRLGIMLPGVAGAVVASTVWLLPESPRYIMQKRKYEAGRAALQRLRYGDCSEEATQIFDHLAESDFGEVTYREIFTNPSLRQRTFIACYLQVSQQLSGVNAFLGYASSLLDDAGFHNSKLLNTLWNVVFCVGTVAGLALIDSRMGRRGELLVATICMGPTLVIAGVAVMLNWRTLTEVMLCIYGLSFQFGWGTVPWIYPAEIFSMAEREKAVSFVMLSQFGVNSIVYIVTPYLTPRSMAQTLVLAGVLKVVNIYFIRTCIKETRGLPLEAIPALFTSARTNRLVQAAIAITGQ
mmetsp:Transcript_104799/g.337907  ORF Transcript_104799/g.337907 Transcript_104799/m.337907 type:complete len:486 (+) Transcript_104799:66-1523(+)